ncbi:MAG TPA: hypothetical protein VNN10_13420 [Dehalococcoidia bacterium]|nr:hypothetical protein [Dehalococcoidia bacterium]
MAEVFAGFVCGYLVALVGAPLLGITLARRRADSPLLARLMPEGSPLAAFVVVLHGGLVVACTGVGLVMGMALWVMRGAGPGAGSPNAAFTLLVAALVLAGAAPAFALLSRYRAQVLAAALAVLLLFGWLMPHMAGWSKFGSS